VTATTRCHVATFGAGMRPLPGHGARRKMLSLGRPEFCEVARIREVAHPVAAPRPFTMLTKL
jgi:hypothetical protein